MSIYQLSEILIVMEEDKRDFDRFWLDHDCPEFLHLILH